MEGRSRRQKYTRGHGPAATEDGPAAGSSAAAWSRGPSASIPDHVPDLGIRTPGEAAPECSALARCLSGLVAGTTVRFTPLVPCVVHLFYPPTLYLGLDRDEDLQPPTCKRGLQGPGLVITVSV
ncbi:hypothetical protein MJG53_017828 [Ovis ammon polii x Ovis aries]|uniref:Uncharacterized protein n=1 Tax=Ovis ammon polii x Ovis aries TaxID=2918886 RepID=A0ACB9U4Y0_9CETA|nr:hypothetical protein MJG53_017828 [Ovis ammon polii x Ovis aries]